MSLEGRQGAYANLGVKVINYPMLQRVRRWARHTFHQGQLELSGKGRRCLKSARIFMNTI